MLGNLFAKGFKGLSLSTPPFEKEKELMSQGYQK
jgi:hypothetical protein